MTDVVIVRAAWVVSMDGPPRPDGWVATVGDRIVALGQGAVDERVTTRRLWDTLAALGVPARADTRRVPSMRQVDLGQAALVPGLVNAHTHLELSSLRGRVPPAPSMPQWVRTLLAVRVGSVDDLVAIEAAIDETVACGTVAVGDVSNGLTSVGVLAGRPLEAVVFHEVLGFDSGDAEARARAARERVEAMRVPAHVRLRLAPHAPYSTSPELVRALARESGAPPPPVTTVHVAESAEEGEFLERGTGPWRVLLEDLGSLPGGWCAPGVGPVAFLDALGLWRPGALAVHGVHLGPRDLELLAGRGVTVVTCPRSNRWVGAGDPPVERFAGSGARIAVGTDSLASVASLSLFDELAALRRLAPGVSARTLLTWATTNGAAALGLEREYGSLVPGRRARFLAVRVAAGGGDVEEWLVSGVAAADVRWVDVRTAVAA